MVARVEGVEPDRLDRLGAPQAQRVDRVAAPADDRRVVGHRQNALGRLPCMAFGAVPARLARHLAAEADLVHDLAALEFPGVAEGQPVLGRLDLCAVDDALLEQAVVVADAVAEAGDAERRHALHEAGGEPAEAAVAEGCVRFELRDGIEVEADERQRLAHLLLQAEVAERVLEQAADQEFEREIVDALAARALGLADRGHPAVDDLVAHGENRRGQPVVVQRHGRLLADVVDELGLDLLPQRLDGGGGFLVRGGAKIAGSQMSGAHADVGPVVHGHKLRGGLLNISINARGGGAPHSPAGAGTTSAKSLFPRRNRIYLHRESFR